MPPDGARPGADPAAVAALVAGILRLAAVRAVSLRYMASDGGGGIVQDGAP